MAALLAVIITYLTLAPASSLPATHVSDKLEHMLAFGTLVLPVGLMRPAKIWQAAFLALALGGLIELIQPFFGRDTEFADFAADAFGIALAVGLCLGHRVALRARA